jgi:uncharacterized protein with PIN domain
MVIDTSALVAILKAELDAEALLMRINRADTRLISSATMLEISIVVFGQLAKAGLHELELYCWLMLKFKQSPLLFPIFTGHYMVGASSVMAAIKLH